MKFSKEVKTGILAIVAIALLVVGYNFLKGKNVFKDERIFYAVYNDVEGLGMSSAVTVNGLKVGSVQDIAIDNTNGQLTVKFNVERKFPFSKKSIARIYGGGIIGGKSIAIIPEWDNGPMAESGDTLNSDIEEGIMELVNERLSPLQGKIESATVSADSLLTSLNDVLDSKTKQNLRQAIDNINQATGSFKNTSQEIEMLLVDNREKINRSMTNLDKGAENFATLSDSLAQLQVGKLVNDVEEAIAGFKEISDKLNSNEGSVGKLINDEALYNNLEGATRQLEQLLQDIKLNPKRYVHFSVFGKKNKEYEAPENPDE